MSRHLAVHRGRFADEGDGLLKPGVLAREFRVGGEGGVELVDLGGRQFPEQQRGEALGAFLGGELGGI